MYKFILLVVCIIVLSNSCVSYVEDTSNNGDGSSNSPIRDNDSTIESLELGDMVSISATKHSEEDWTYDYTGLLLDDSYSRNTNVDVYYFLDNQTSEYINKVEIRPPLHKWQFYGANESYWHVINDITNSYFKQRTNTEMFDLDSALRRVSIEVIKNDGEKDYHYFFKGIHNGIGPMELVGRSIADVIGDTTWSEGDTNITGIYEQ